jgi:multidrug efflux pump subunit AcrA (membrane-fusion protein)
MDTAQIRLVSVGLFLLGLVGCGAVIGWILRGHEVKVLRSRLATAVTQLAQREAAARAADAEAERKVRLAEQRAKEALQAIQARIREKEDELQKSRAAQKQMVPVYIPTAVDRNYPLPNGFVWLHNQAVASAGGEGCPADDTAASAETAGAASSITLSEAASTILYNYSQIEDCAERLRAWQDYYRNLTAAQTP